MKQKGTRLSHNVSSYFSANKSTCKRWSSGQGEDDASARMSLQFDEGENQVLPLEGMGVACRMVFDDVKRYAIIHLMT